MSDLYCSIMTQKSRKWSHVSNVADSLEVTNTENFMNHYTTPAQITNKVGVQTSECHIHKAKPTQISKQGQLNGHA